MRFFVHKRPHVDYFLSMVSLKCAHVINCGVVKVDGGMSGRSSVGVDGLRVMVLEWMV